MKLTYIYKFLFVLSIGSFVACNDSLDEEPQSSLIPENYLNAETQLESYANNLYDDYECPLKVNKVHNAPLNH